MAKMMKRYEPDTFNNSLRLTKAQISRWASMSLEECLLSGNPACVFAEGSKRDSSVAYFCGQRDFCNSFGSEKALKLAKANIEAFYPLVLILERLEESLKLAEKLLPKLFNGSLAILKRLERFNSMERKDVLSQRAFRILKFNLAPEYELYDFLLQRLSRQKV